MKIGSLNIRHVADKKNPLVGEVVVRNGWGDKITVKIGGSGSEFDVARAYMVALVAWNKHVEKGNPGEHIGEAVNISL